MTIEPSTQWGMDEMPPLTGDPFALARSSCRHAALVASDVFIDEDALQRFAARIDPEATRNLPHGSMGENCDTVASDFGLAREAVNFAVLFWVVLTPVLKRG